MGLRGRNPADGAETGGTPAMGTRGKNTFDGASREEPLRWEVKGGTIYTLDGISKVGVPRMGF